MSANVIMIETKIWMGRISALRIKTSHVFVYFENRWLAISVPSGIILESSILLAFLTGMP